MRTEELRAAISHLIMLYVCMYHVCMYVRMYVCMAAMYPSSPAPPSLCAFSSVCQVPCSHLRRLRAEPPSLLYFRRIATSLHSWVFCFAPVHGIDEPAFFCKWPPAAFVGPFGSSACWPACRRRLAARPTSSARAVLRAGDMSTMREPAHRRRRRHDGCGPRRAHHRLMSFREGSAA